MKLFFHFPLLLILFWAMPLTANHTLSAFSEPFSGKKVTEYQADLAIGRGLKRQFSIPRDCQEILDYSRVGSISWGSQVDRNLWLKVVNDCQYSALLHRNGKAAEVDYVSQYDFFNAALKDLPFYSGCGGSNPMDAIMDCLDIPGKLLNLSTFFPFLEKQHMGAASGEIIECKFTEGIFRGRISRTATGIVCRKDHHAPGLRLISVDFSDLNNDGFQDVVMRMMPLGRGISRMPIILPLTRYKDSGAFVIPNGISVEKVNRLN